MTYTEQERINAFWSKVDKSGGPDSCWPWLANLNQDGYGQIRWHGKMRLSHRIAWFLTNGPIPNSLCVLHHCDNPKCCNPKHLWLGTHVNNMHDMYSKNRRCAANGEKNGRSKLTKWDVEKIRYEYSQTDITQKELADRFGVNDREISNIVTGKNWK